MFYLNEYVDAFMHEDESSGMPILLYCENGIDRSINVVFKRDVIKNQHFAGRLTPNAFFDYTILLWLVYRRNEQLFYF